MFDCPERRLGEISAKDEEREGEQKAYTCKNRGELAKQSCRIAFRG